MEAIISTNDLRKAEEGLAPARTSGVALDGYKHVVDAVVKGVVVAAAEKDAEALENAIATKAEDICHVSVSTLVVHPGHLVDKTKATGTIGIKGKIIIIHTTKLTSEEIGYKAGSTGITEVTTGDKKTLLRNIILELHMTYKHPVETAEVGRDRAATEALL